VVACRARRRGAPDDLAEIHDRNFTTPRSCEMKRYVRSCGAPEIAEEVAPVGVRAESGGDLVMPSRFRALRRLSREVERRYESSSPFVTPTSPSGVRLIGRDARGDAGVMRPAQGSAVMYAHGNTGAVTPDGAA
jgi:hypothetical protein